MNKNFQRKMVNIFLPINFNIYFGCQKEVSHLDRSSEYPKHMFWLRKRKLNFRYSLLAKVLHVTLCMLGKFACFFVIC